MVLLHPSSNLSPSLPHPKVASPDDNATTTADYIVIGGGTAGLVVANRLTENPDVTVLVLKAGHNLDADQRVSVPAFWTTLMGSEADWQYYSVPRVSQFARERVT